MNVNDENKNVTDSLEISLWRLWRHSIRICMSVIVWVYYVLHCDAWVMFACDCDWNVIVQQLCVVTD